MEKLCISDVATYLAFKFEMSHAVSELPNHIHFALSNQIIIYELIE